MIEYAKHNMVTLIKLITTACDSKNKLALPALIQSAIACDKELRAGGGVNTAELVKAINRGNATLRQA